MEQLDLSFDQRGRLWIQLTEQLNHYLENTQMLPVAPELDPLKIKKFVEVDLEAGQGIDKALQIALEGMRNYTVHTPHPSYYGLFNPRANFPSILADTITAAFNPQMAAWSHSPFAAEAERYLVQELSKKFGYKNSDGVFASGGAEANQTAILCALNDKFPQYATKGLIEMNSRPLIYCSTEAHHSIVKAARSSGLGSDSVKSIPVDNSLVMDTNELKNSIIRDIDEGYTPFMVVATFGTTGAGSLDPLDELALIVDNFGLWMHVDAAYGGAVALSSSQGHLLKGISSSDSITFDIHKWLSVPMGCSVFLTSHQDILHQTFRITTEYMPKEARELEITDAFTHSVQWSRRFIGFKLYLSLLSFGWEGYRAMIDHTLAIGNYLKEQLVAHQWEILNDTPLPIVCFRPASSSTKSIEDICKAVVDSGNAWLSVYPVNGKPCLRACITNYITQRRHIDELVELLAQCRQ